MPPRPPANLRVRARVSGCVCQCTFVRHMLTCASVLKPVVVYFPFLSFPLLSLPFLFSSSSSSSSSSPGTSIGVGRSSTSRQYEAREGLRPDRPRGLNHDGVQHQQNGGVYCRHQSSGCTVATATATAVAAGDQSRRTGVVRWTGRPTD